MLYTLPLLKNWPSGSSQSLFDILSSPWAVQTSIATCSTEFALKKEGNTHDLQYLSWHQGIIDFNICVTIPLLWLRLGLFHHQSTRLQPIMDLKLVLGGPTSRSTPIQYLVVLLWEGSPELLLIKTTGGSHNEWWAVRVVGRSLSPTLEDVNISFNHSPYYSISGDEGRVVTDKRVA